MKKIMPIILILVVTTVVLGASWGICCGLIKLISICFGFNFSIKIATGIWLVIAFVNFFRDKKGNTSIK